MSRNREANERMRREAEAHEQVYGKPARAREAELERERDEWRKVTGQPDPDALSSYLSRETLPESNERTGRVIADLSSRLSASQERERGLSGVLMRALADLVRMGERDSTPQMLKKPWREQENRDDLLSRHDVLEVVSRARREHDDVRRAALQSPPTPAPEPEDGPTWACRGCGFSGSGFSTVTHSAGDCDVECPECGSEETSESAEEALRIVVDELDTLRATSPAPEPVKCVLCEHYPLACPECGDGMPPAPESEREKRLIGEVVEICRSFQHSGPFDDSPGERAAAYSNSTLDRVIAAVRALSKSQEGER